MEKNTLEKIENDYKEAIRIKFKAEKDEGKHSHYLSNPSQALLRDLCWEIFNSNPKADDLNVYRNFFRTEFNSEENTSTQYTDKFKKVGAFYKGGIQTSKISTVELAAILVDFEPRPFGKFKKQHDEDELKLITELRNTPFSNPEFASDNLVDEVKIENSIEPKETFDIEEPEETQTQDSELIQEEEEPESASMTISTFATIDKEPKSNKWKYFAIITVLFGLGLIIYLALPQKGCMQWSNDHYELVDCDLKVEGFGMVNQIELLDKNLVNLKKVNVSDTTVFFDKNGDALIWYAKTANGIDFFNCHGRHPENNRPLRPVTQYILNKYVRK